MKITIYDRGDPSVGICGGKLATLQLEPWYNEQLIDNGLRDDFCKALRDFWEAWEAAGGLEIIFDDECPDCGHRFLSGQVGECPDCGGWRIRQENESF